MRIVPTLCTILLLLAGSVRGQDHPADPVEKELEALLAEHEQSDLKFTEGYRAFLPRFEEFARKHRGSEAEARATLWLIQQAWWLRDEGKMESTSMPLAEDLLKRHPQSQHLHLLVEYSYVFTKEQRQALYERMLDVSPHASVKAAAHFGLAQLSPARLADGSPNPHYAKLLGEYRDVKWRETTYGRIADARVNPHAPADLAVGKPAPEIEGIDHNGNPMKLSDFRGRVVLLDFWGDW